MFGFGKELNKENILKKITSFDIFNYYIPGGVLVNQPILSPLRDESNPSFIISNKYSSDGELYYKDFKLGTGDCITFVAKKNNISYFDALKLINRDFNLKLGFKETETGIFRNGNVGTITNYIPEKVYKDLRIQSRPFDHKDKEYWSSIGISSSTLEKGQVKALRKYWILSGKEVTVVNCRTLTYCYCFGGYKYKIYQPFNPPKFKFITNCNEYQGLSLLPDKGDILIIEKSYKDVLLLYEFGIPSFSPPSESVLVSAQLMVEMKDRFQNIYTFSDYDNQGIHFAWEMRKNYQTKPLFLSEGVWKRKQGYKGAKDISDYSFLYGKPEAFSVMKKLINGKE